MADSTQPIKVKFCLKEDCSCDGHLTQLRCLVLDEIKMMVNDLDPKEKDELYRFLHHAHRCRI